MIAFNFEEILNKFFNLCVFFSGLYRTSCPVRKSDKFSKSRLSFPDAGIEKNPSKFKDLFFKLFSNFFLTFCLFIYMVKCLKMQVRIQFGLLGPVWQILVSSPGWSGNSYICPIWSSVSPQGILQIRSGKRRVSLRAYIKS